QMSLAQRIGVSEGYIGQIENPKNRAKYNIRTMAKVAKALGLNQYQELFPSEVLNEDLVRIRLKLFESYSKKHEVDEDGKVKRRFEIISEEPLTEEELEKWKVGELNYLRKIEK